MEQKKKERLSLVRVHKELKGDGTTRNQLESCTYAALPNWLSPLACSVKAPDSEEERSVKDALYMEK